MKLILLLALLLETALAAAVELDNIYGLPYRFTDEAGTVRQLSDWKGRETVVAMDHSTWGAVCSSTARRLRAVQIAAERMGADLDFVIIGLEPEKDTPQSWARYRQTREVAGKNWHFLRASVEDTPRIAAQLGVNYRYEYDELILDLRLLRVDATGRVRRLLEGYDTDTEAFLR